MVKLLGVVHGGQQTDLFFGETREIELFPSPELEKRLASFPPGTKVGVEWFSQDILKEIRAHRRKLIYENDITSMIHDSECPYWDWVLNTCKEAGHEVVLLEDKEIWFKFNKAFIDLVNTDNKFGRLVQKVGESERSYHQKLISLNDERYRSQIFLEKVHVLERDELILKKIKETGVQVVIAGIGHTDYWMLAQEDIRSRHGITFEEYSTDNIVNTQTFSLKFTENATPNPQVAYDFEGLRRALHLFETGRFFSEKPDWVGTWDVLSPFRGYFEVFIKKTINSKSVGRIEDCLGSAEFEGKIGLESVNFIKSYDDQRCSSHAIKTEIAYTSNNYSNLKDCFSGYFKGPDSCFSTAFYIEKYKGNSPLEFSLSWFDLSETIKKIK